MENKMELLQSLGSLSIGMKLIVSGGTGAIVFFVLLLIPVLLPIKPDNIVEAEPNKGDVKQLMENSAGSTQIGNAGTVIIHAPSQRNIPPTQLAITPRTEAAWRSLIVGKTKREVRDVVRKADKIDLLGKWWFMGVVENEFAEKRNNLVVTFSTKEDDAVATSIQVL